MSNSAFSIEVVELIIENFISSIRDHHQEVSEFKFFSYWQRHLMPLLRACNPWHAIPERLMYHRMSLGSEFFVADPDENGLPKRLGHKVAEQLLATMSTSFRIASLVKEPRLAIRDVQHAEASECTRTNFHILQLFPNVRYVEIRGLHHP